MDAIISSALEEICAQGRHGLALSSLCSKLGLSVDLKRALWTNLFKIPTVQFQVPNGVYDPDDHSIRCFEDAEKLDLIIVAREKLRDNFLGIYDFSLGADEKEFRRQRLVLERIASARTNGITQSQLSKEFGMEGNKTFYMVRNLEKRGLIVRQEAVERTRGAGNQGQSTRLIHLHRYAKHLGSQQKFEITKEEETVGNQDPNIEHIKEGVLVKDYVPSMKAICDKLEEADSKVLVISDIKHDLGYSGSRSKRRDWENACGRLKNADVVEETYVKVNGKDERCLHLLKKFSLVDFEQKPIKHVEGKELKFGRCQIANQLVELPIVHQIYDAIDAAGVEGMLIKEVSQRFGVDMKTNYKNCCIMSTKFGMPMQRELHNKNCEYRIWTAKNCESSDAIPSRSKDIFSKNSSLGAVNPGFSDGSAQILGLLNSESDTLGKTNNRETEIELSCCSTRGIDAGDSISNTCKSQELIRETKKVVSDTGLHSMNSQTMPRKPRQYLTVDNTRREQRIVEWLQVEKIVLRAELYRWLVNLEKDKSTTMARKSVDRILYKLENQGQCKCVHLPVHEIMNTDANRKVKVVLHPSIQSLSSEVLGRIRYRLMSFEKQTHGQGSFKKKNINSVLVLDGVQRTHTQAGSDALALRMAAMRANGFISGKMVRAKLLHTFLWDYACSSPARDDVLSYGRQDHDLQNPYVTHNLFDVKAAIEGIPLELFLQVVGSTVQVDNMIEKFRKGVRLCDLSIREYNDLNVTPAIRRLSSILSILQRLKLIRPVTSESSEDGIIVPHASPMYVLELKPCIEEPPLIATCSSSGCLDCCPGRDAVDEIVRHDFILSNRDAIDEYWQVLEYIYAVADPKAALHAFPGSTVHEIFGHKSWASGRGMTASQQAKVLKLIVKSNFNKKLPYKECKEIAKNLNLTLEQVLRVCHAKLRHRSKIQDNLDAVGAECQPMNSSSLSRKRKRSAEARALKLRKVDNETGPFCQHSLPRSAGSGEDFMGEENLMLASPREHETWVQEHQEEDHWKTSEKPGVNRDKCDSYTSPPAFSKMKSARQRRFPWTDEADRQLVIQYVKHRAGAKFSDKSGASLSDLPAPPTVCRRRMSFLKQNRKFRESLISLCNMLSEHYEKHPEETESRSMDDDDRGLLIPCSSGAGNYRSFFEGIGCNQTRGVQEEHCDNYNMEKIKLALEELLRSRRVATLEAPGKPGNVCDSQFPSNTGSTAARFSRWLRAREKDFLRGGIDLSPDLTCGEIFHLFALVSSCELFISPCVPVDGVGEAEYIRNLQHTSLFNDPTDYRREKGFPGIKLSVHQAPMSRAVALESSFKNWEKCGNEHFVGDNYLGGISASLDIGSNSSHSEVVNENVNFRSTVPTPGYSCDSPWELLVGYATLLMPLPSNQEHVGTLSPEVFKTVYTAIQKAGDQGLAIREVSRFMDTLGEEMAELVIDVLQKFGLAEKVRINGSLRVIAGSKKKSSSIHVDYNDVQKFNILNHHKNVDSLPDKTHTVNLYEDSMQRNIVLPGANNRHGPPEGCKCHGADGITKKNMHKRIIRQTFRIVMQNPGILEDDIVRNMDLPNLQHCKKLLRLMVRDKHLIMKKMHQSLPSGVPSILGTLNMKRSKLIYREHFFANPMSTSLL